MNIHKGVLYLGIHSITDSNELNCISFQTICKIVDELLSAGWKIEEGALVNSKSKHYKKIVFTSDDGRALSPEFKKFFDKYELKCMYFICTASEIIGCPQKLNFPLKASDLSWLRENKHTLGCHTSNHMDLKNLNKEVTFSYLKESKERLEELTQREIKYFSYPWGKRNSVTVKSLKQLGYKAAWIAAPGIPIKFCNFTIPRLFIDSGKHQKISLTACANGRLSFENNFKVSARSLFQWI